MYPAAFEYTAPQSLEETPAILGDRDDDGRILVGGLRLIPMTAG